MHICAWLCPCLSMCTCMLMYVETREQSHVPFSRLCAPLSRHWFFPNLELREKTTQTAPAGPRHPSVCAFAELRIQACAIPVLCLVWVFEVLASADWVSPWPLLLHFYLLHHLEKNINKMNNQFEIVHWKLEQFDLDIQPPFPSMPLSRFSGGISAECGSSVLPFSVPLLCFWYSLVHSLHHLLPWS